MALLEPLVGSALAALLLGDRLAPAGLAGAALLITALLLEPLTRRGTGLPRRGTTALAEPRYE
jgi:DME family drug/metabolite transporter